MSCENPAFISICGQDIAIDPSSLPGGIDYSTEEQWTGRHWIDGRKVYQKTIACSFDGVKKELNFPHGISNLDVAIELDCVWNLANAPGHCAILPYISQSNTSNIHVQISSGNVAVMSLGTTVRNGAFYMTMRYVCFDR